MPFASFDASTRMKIADIAQAARLTPEAVYQLWCDYDRDPARNQHQDPTLSEFVRDYAPWLGGPPHPPETAAA
jgi:hypothetical protein